MAHICYRKTRDLQYGKLVIVVKFSLYNNFIVKYYSCLLPLILYSVLLIKEVNHSHGSNFFHVNYILQFMSEKDQPRWR